MQFFRTTGTLIIPAGFRLSLNEIQIRDRGTSLVLKQKGKIQEVKKPIQFKRGEVLGIEEPNKIMLEVLEKTEEARVDAAGRHSNGS